MEDVFNGGFYYFLEMTVFQGLAKGKQKPKHQHTIEKIITVKKVKYGNPIMRGVFVFVELLLKHEMSQWLEGMILKPKGSGWARQTPGCVGSNPRASDARIHLQRIFRPHHSMDQFLLWSCLEAITELKRINAIHKRMKAL